MTTTQHRILIVDDNPGDIELVRIAFEMAGLPVVIESVSDGIEAMRLLSTVARDKALPAMVLLDLNMPRANGFEVLDFMCVRHLVDQVPVIVMSTSLQVEDRRRCLALGARAMYSKPDSIQDLRQLVEAFRIYLSQSSVGGPV
ncbi:MAG: response regulator [Planctomycetes bacterium]|nr:response regulator [Planctomycetota bacterium]